MELKCNLKWLIAKCGKNQNEVAEEMGISKQLLSNWIAGRNYPRHDKALKLAKIINTDISNLYEEIDSSDMTKKEEV